MAFLDKMSDIAKTVGDKAGDAFEFTKQNAKILSEKAAIEKKMAEIGKLCYENHKDGLAAHDPQIAELFAAVEAHYEAIAKAEEEIAAQKAE